MSNNSLTVLARLIAALLAACFVVTAVAGLVLFNVDRRAFNPATYTQALAGGNFYQQFPSLLGDLLAKNIPDNAPAFLQRISVDQWKVLLEALLPGQQMQSMAEDTLNQVFAYINGGSQPPVISLVPLKNSLAGPAGMNAVLTIIQAQPDCTIEQLARIVNTFGQELCNPPKGILDLIQPVIQIELQSAASAIPDSISILNAVNNGSIESGMKDLRLIRLVMRFSPLLPIGLLFVITVLAVRTFKAWLAWWGWPLLLTGLFGLPIGLTGAPLLRWVMERWLNKRFTITITPEISASLRTVVDAALRQILKPVVWESLALIIIGLIMVVFWVYLAIREKNKVAASEAMTQII
jgi:hypothetical protein